MKTGMLWYGGNKPLEEQLKEASDYYSKKYGITPNKAFVPVSALPAGKTDQMCGLVIEGNQQILPKHVWLGVAA